MPSLSFGGVSRHFGGLVALADVDLTIDSGSLTAIIGPTGCGKTTLLEIGAGLQPPTRGEVLLDGVPVAGPSPETVMIFQHHNLFGWLSVRDNVAFGLRNLGLRRSEARGRAMEHLGNVGLAEFADKVPAELSGGMRQRVALARALAVDPKVLLMDEPFASLDYQTRRVMRRYLLSTWRQVGATVALVTHDLDEALVLADRVALMSGAPGRVVEVVDLELERPRRPDDPRLRDVRHHLQRHLQAEVALSEFTGAELAALMEDIDEPPEAITAGNGSSSARRRE
jgi:ABC-type nitrate/sulfonate/bicarbonate transport system ATPase subunit